MLYHWATEDYQKVKPGNDLLSRSKSSSTIGAGELNCRVRNGHGCFLSAIITRNIISFFFLLLTSLAHSFSLKTAQHLLKSSIKSLSLGQALGLLVPVSLIHCCTYTSGLSTCLSFRGLTVQEATNMIQEAGLLAFFSYLLSLTIAPPLLLALLIFTFFSYFLFLVSCLLNVGNLILRRASRLDAFSTYPFQT